MDYKWFKKNEFFKSFFRLFVEKRALESFC